MNNVMYSNHNNTPFELVKTINHTINKGIFGLQESSNSYIFKNTKDGKEVELIDEHILALLHEVN